MTSDHDRDIPRLDLRLPIACGLLGVAAFIAAGVGGAASTVIDSGVRFSGKFIVDSQPVMVHAVRGGSLTEVNVTEGQHVAAGDVIVALDTLPLREQIAALQAQSEAATRQLELVRSEAATMSDLLQRKLASKARVLQLELKLQEISKEAAGLTSRIAVAQAEIDRSAVRAPVSGKVRSLGSTRLGAAVEPDIALLEIVPHKDKVVVEGRLTEKQAEDIKSGMPAQVWLAASSWRAQQALPAKLTWVAANAVTDKRTGQLFVSVRAELEQTQSEIADTVSIHPGLRAEILLVTGQRSLLSHWIDPLVRSVANTFRG